MLEYIIHDIKANNEYCSDDELDNALGTIAGLCEYFTKKFDGCGECPLFADDCKFLDDWAKDNLTRDRILDYSKVMEIKHDNVKESESMNSTEYSPEKFYNALLALKECCAYFTEHNLICDGCPAEPKNGEHCPLIVSDKIPEDWELNKPDEYRAFKDDKETE